MKKWLILLLVLSLILMGGCSAPNTVDDPKENGGQTNPTVSRPDEKMFTDRDKKTQYSETKSVRIEFNGSTAATASNSVRIDGSTVTITGEETYILSGTLTVERSSLMPMKRRSPSWCWKD